jgi:hypothetical protein
VPLPFCFNQVLIVYMAEALQKRRRGCLFFVLVAGAISVVMLAFGAYFGLRYAHQLVNRLTDAQAAVLPTVQLPETRMFQLHDKVDTFRDAVRDGEVTAPLELSAEELNALIGSDPAFKVLKNHLFVMIEGSQLSAQISFRAEDLGLMRLQGRYVNATGNFHVAMKTNELWITAQSLAVRGEPIPRNIMREVAAENLAERFNDDPRAAAGLKKIDSIEVKDGKLVIVPKK